MDTVFLNPGNWDLDLDADSNIALSTSAYAVAQDVASQALLWSGEAPYNSDDGIPYEEAILGQRPSQASIAAWYEDEAVKVPDVAAASAFIEYEGRRDITGQIQITLTDGTVINV